MKYCMTYLEPSEEDFIIIDGYIYDFKYIYYNAKFECLFINWYKAPIKISEEFNNYYIGEL